MMYNPNNVATEASPLTTGYEKEVGDQLCRMLGYAGPKATKKQPASWGHITCVCGGLDVPNLPSPKLAPYLLRHLT